MPELPEVEVVRRGLAPLLVGRQVLDFSFSNRKLRVPVPRKELRRLIKGARISAVERRAKYLLIRMENGAILVIHLGMSGRVGLFGSKEPVARHDHLRCLLDNGQELRFNDTRRFGSIQVVEPGGFEASAIFANIGPEPFARRFSPAYLVKKAAARRQPVKNFLMDSRIVAGIGNIYASEILFAAGIMPVAPVGDITPEQWQAVIRFTRKILHQAIKSGGTTISDFINSSGETGWFQLQLKVYGRHRKKCRKCQCLIEKTVMAGRATYHCPGCQKL